MRTEKEIDHAIAQLRDVQRGAPKVGDEALKLANAVIIAALEWAKGSETNGFGEMLAACDRVDAHGRG